MNPVILIMLIFAAAGLLDKILGGKLSLSKDFDQGLSFMGSIALSLVGVTCLGVYAVQANSQAIASITGHFPFDPSLIIGALLAPDMGGLPISLEIASTEANGVFSGALLSACLGTLICFQLPVFLSALDKGQMLDMMKGFLLGLVVIPGGLAIGGLLLGLSPKDLLLNLVPVIIICAVLGLAFKLANNLTAACLLRFGQAVQIISFLLFALVIAGLYIPAFAIADYQMVADTFISVGKMTVIICGSMVLSHIALIVFPDQLHWISKKLRTNEVSVVGLILSMTSSLAMIPLFHQMDNRGKIMNAAFSVSGAYVLGGQMAYVAGLTSSMQLSAYIITKLICGLCAIALAFAVTKDEEGVPEVMK